MCLIRILPFLRFFALRKTNFSKLFGTENPENTDDNKSTKSQTDSESKTDWQVILAKLVTAYKVINQTNTVIGKLGFALLLSDKRELKMILYKSKIDLLSTVIVRESNKVYVKGNFVQYLDDHQNFWSVLFENESDKDETLRVLEERCTIQNEEMEKSANANDAKVDESETNEENTKLCEGDVETSDKACETDPEEKQAKQIKTNILTRMARMGKKIVLPNKTVNSEISDSSDPESSPKRLPKKPPTPVLQVAKIQPGPTAHSTSQTVEFVKHGHGNIISASSDSSLNLMMMQNTEIRFNLSKLDTKLDKLCDKLDILSTSSLSISSDKNNNDNVREEDIMRLEEKILSLKKENLSLKSIIREFEEKSRNIKEHSLDEINEIKVQMKSLQQENRNISLELETKNEKLQIFEAKLRNTIEEREIEIKTKDADMAELKSQLNMKNRYIQDLQTSLDRIQILRDSSTTKESQTENKHELAPSEVMIKEIMNNLYFKLCEKISNANDLKHSDVLKIIGQTIKQETSECLKKSC